MRKKQKGFHYSALERNKQKKRPKLFIRAALTACKKSIKGLFLFSIEAQHQLCDYSSTMDFLVLPGDIGLVLHYLCI